MNPTVPEHLQLGKPPKLNMSKSRTSLASPTNLYILSLPSVVTCSTIQSSQAQIQEIPSLDFTLPHPLTSRRWLTSVDSTFLIPLISLPPFQLCPYCFIEEPPALSRLYYCSGLLTSLSSPGPALHTPSTLCFQEIILTTLFLCSLLFIEQRLKSFRLVEKALLIYVLLPFSPTVLTLLISLAPISPASQNVFGFPDLPG